MFRSLPIYWTFLRFLREPSFRTIVYANSILRPFNLWFRFRDALLTSAFFRYFRERFRKDRF